MKLYFHPEARIDLHDAQDYYRTKSRSVAIAFSDQIAWAIDNISEAPGRWKEHFGGTRRFSLSRFPYAVIYRVVENDIQVIAIAHHRRRPGYWAPRLVD